MKQALPISPVNASFFITKTLEEKLLDYRKPVNPETRPEIYDLLDRTIALKNGWEEHALKDRKLPDRDGKLSDADSKTLVDYWSDIRDKLINFSARNNAEIDMKLRCMSILNSVEKLTFQDRIDEADGMSDGIVWSIVRDLADVRLNLSDPRLPPRYAENL